MFVLALAEPHKLEGAICNDFVGCHIGRGSGATLDDIDCELIVQASINNFMARALYAVQDLFRKLLAFIIGARRCQFYHCQCSNQIGVLGNRNTRNVKVF